MTNLPTIPQDDLVDIVELSFKIERYIDRTLKDHDKHIAVSSLISASAHSIILKCDTVKEALYFKYIFMEIYDKILEDSIKNEI